MKYELWHVPRPGKESLWNTEHLIGAYDTLPHAQEEQYFAWADEPAPDKHEFFSLQIREVP